VRRLSAIDVFPAGSTDISARMLTLRSGLRLRVVEGGDARGDPVLMLHGWGASAFSFRHAFDRLGGHGAHVVAVDLRGFGLSEKPGAAGSYSAVSYREDIDQLFEVLGIERAFLVGHSMGGGIALQYALDRPERTIGLALISPTNLVSIPLLAVPKLAPRFIARWVGKRLIPRALVELILHRIAYGDSALITEEIVDQYWVPTQLPGYAYAARASLSEFDWAPTSAARAQELAVPAVVILGRQDRLIRGASAPAYALRGAAVHELDTGHCVHEEQPERAYALIARHLFSR
jgi:4,5:9,10-diseco-3-hydroxy-5,9,17-trioxoandrosta-1(10),2-diene-4-oate hydrolase